jgi:hypothetical protein
LGMYRAGTSQLGFATAGVNRLTMDSTAAAFSTLLTTPNGINITGSSQGIENGNTGAVNTPYIDFHSSGNNIDYDARIVASGGTGSTGQGTLTFTAATATFGGTIGGNGSNITALNGSNVSTGTVAGARLAQIDLTASGNGGVGGILGAVNGGTGNGFTAFSGPATSTKTFTLPNASTTILTTNAAVTVAQGGTGAATLTGVLHGNGTSAVTAGNVALASEVSGTLPVANGGTGTTTSTGTGSTVLSASPALTGSPTVGGVGICLTDGTGCASFVTQSSTTATGTATGCTTAPTATMRLTKTGNAVTFSWDGATDCTSNATTLTYTAAIPSGYRPIRTVQGQTLCLDSGSLKNCHWVINPGVSDSTVILGLDSTSGAFTSSGQKGWTVAGGTGSYILN